MKNKYKLCVGLLTFCDDKKSKERFEIMKKCVDSLYNLKQEDVFIYVWDNNSSKNVKDFLLSRKDLFNEMYFLEKNLFDNVAINFLAKNISISFNFIFKKYFISSTIFIIFNVGPQLHVIDEQHKQSLPDIFFKSSLNIAPVRKNLLKSLPFR